MVYIKKHAFIYANNSGFLSLISLVVNVRTCDPSSPDVDWSCSSCGSSASVLLILIGCILNGRFYKEKKYISDRRVASQQFSLPLQILIGYKLVLRAIKLFFYFKFFIFLLCKSPIPSHPRWGPYPSLL